MHSEANPVEVIGCSLVTNVDQSAPHQIIADLLIRMCQRSFLTIDYQFGMFWRFIGITDASELKDLPSTRLGI